MIGICTDSNSQLPETLATRYAVEVVPAGEAISNGANIDEVVRAAESLMPHIGAVFVVGELDFIRTGGRHVSGVPVMTVNDGRVDVVSRVSTASGLRRVGDRWLLHVSGSVSDSPRACTAQSSSQLKKL